MMSEFDRDFWEAHWSVDSTGQTQHLPVNPYLAAETAHLRTGTALDAGCGAGTEAIWFAEQGWQVTAADIAETALSSARERAAQARTPDRIEWVNTDLSRWDPGRTWDLVTSSYAHAQIGQLALYRRLATWVAPGGTFLIVGHVHGHDHPAVASATVAAITDQLDTAEWQVESNYKNTRTVQAGASSVQLRDVIVRARKLN